MLIKKGVIQENPNEFDFIGEVKTSKNLTIPPNWMAHIKCEFITKDMGTKTLPATYQPELNLCMDLVIMETWQELLQRKPKPLKSRFTAQSVKRLDI